MTTYTGKNAAYRIEVKNEEKSISYTSHNIYHNSNDIQVYPTIAKNRVSVLTKRWGTNYHYHITNMSGQIMSKGELQENTTNIALDGIAPGNYLITITEGAKEISSFKFIKE